MKKKEEYILCPRCELNYIKKKDKHCAVCKAEMSGNTSEYEDLDLEVCPICKVNFIRPDEIMCTGCAKDHSLAGINIREGVDDEEWQTYVDDEKEDIVKEDEETGDMVNLTEIGEDEIDEIGLDPELEEIAEAFKDEEEEVEDESSEERLEDEEEDIELDDDEEDDD